MRRKTLFMRMLNLTVAVVMMMSLGLVFSIPVAAPVSAQECVNPDCIAPPITVCTGTTFDQQLLLDAGMDCDPQEGTYLQGEDGEYTITRSYDFIQEDTTDLEGTAPTSPGTYIYHVQCFKDMKNYEDCGCFSVGYIYVVGCECNAEDFSICVGTTLDMALFTNPLNGNASCTGEDCAITSIDWSLVLNDTPGTYEYTVHCDRTTSPFCPTSCSAYVTVEVCEECCECVAPNITICVGDPVNDDLFIDAGASCIPPEIPMTLNYLPEWADTPGDYLYTVICDDGCGTQCQGTLTVVPACLPTAPDFSACQGASDDELEVAAEKALAEGELFCSEGCELDFKWESVKTGVLGCYPYTVKCTNPCVDGCPDGCGDAEATGEVCIIPCVDVDIIECPEIDYPIGHDGLAIVPLSTRFVVKAEICNCSGDILNGVIANIEVVEGAATVEDESYFNLGNMDVDDCTEVAWTLHCLGEGYTEVKVWVNECSWDVCEFRQQLPPAMSATCLSPCEVCSNCPDENKYTVKATVTNTGDVAVENVDAEILIDGPAQLDGDLAEKDVEDVLDPGEPADVEWAIKCTGEGPVTFTVLFDGVDQCDLITKVETSCQTTTEQENILVDILCVKGLEQQGQDFTEKTDFTASCTDECLVDTSYSPDAMYEIVSRLQPFLVQAEVENCTDAPADMTATLTIPAGTQLVPGSWVKLYCPSLASTTWVAAAATVALDGVCACCVIEITWILECTASSAEAHLPLVVDVQSALGSYSSMPCSPAYVIQEEKVHLDATMATYVEDCDSECMVPVDAVTMCQEYDVKICITNSGEADAYDVALDIAIAGDTTCTIPPASPLKVYLDNILDVNGDDHDGILEGGETLCYWLSDLINCNLECTGTGTVTITIPNLYGKDENTCEDVLPENIEDVCPLTIKQPNVWVEIENPRNCTDVFTYEVFAVKAKIFNCGPYDLEDVTATLCWIGEGGCGCRGGGDVELVNPENNPRVIPLIPAPDPDCEPPCQSTMHEVSWMVQCVSRGDVEFFVCLEAENPELQVKSLGNREAVSVVIPPSPDCCDTCVERPAYIPAIVHQIYREKADVCVEIVSPDRGAKYATSQEFAVTAVIVNNEEHADITINTAKLKVGKAIRCADIVLGDGIDVLGEPMPALPWVIPAGESKTVTWTVHCNESGLTWFKVMLFGETEVRGPVFAMSMPVWVWQYPAAHLEINITQFPPDPIPTSTLFQVTANITNTGEADATEVYATLSVTPDGSVTVAGPSEDGFTQYVGTIPGHGSEANSVPLTWNLHCKMPCDSTITINAEGADEYGYHIKQSCSNTGNFIIETGVELIEDLDENTPDMNKGWFTGYFIGDANGLTGPFSVDTPISWAGLGGGPDYTGHMVAMGTVVSNIDPEVADFLAGICGPCFSREACVSKDLLVFIGHIITDSEGDVLPPHSMWKVSPGIIQVINGKITGAYDIHGEVVLPDGTVLPATFIKSLLGGTYCTNLAATPGRAIQARFIEPDSVTVKQLPVLTDLGIVKEVDDSSPVMGDMAHFTVTLTNLGPSPMAGSILVMDVLPDELGFDSYDASQGWYDVTSGYWSVGDLAIGVSATLDIWATVNTVGEVCNRATVVSLNQHDPVTTNNSFEVCIIAATAPPTEEKTLDLDDGLNLISLPLIPDSGDVVAVLSGTDFTVVHMYLKSDEDFKSYIKGLAPEAGFVWEDGLGYWLNMNSAEDLDIDGVELVSGPTLPPSYEVFGKDGVTYIIGWNLIGFKSTTAKLPSEYLAGIAGKFVMIYGFDNGAFHAVGSPGHAMMQPGFGYWLAVKDGESGTIFP